MPPAASTVAASRCSGSGNDDKYETSGAIVVMASNVEIVSRRAGVGDAVLCNDHNAASV
jgi:hypothetical protein